MWAVFIRNDISKDTKSQFQDIEANTETNRDLVETNPF